MSDALSGLEITKLLGFEKLGGGIHPVAVRSTWGRLAGKVLCELYKGQWAESVGQSQFAIGLPNGNEILLKLAQTILDSADPASSNPIYLLQIDAKSAFNSAIVKRSTFS